MHFTVATIAVFAAVFAGSAEAHVRLGTKIPGFGRQANMDPFTNRSPLENDASAAFCKGMLTGGKPTALSPGPNTFDLETEMAPHDGGSGQVSLSYDGGKTFKVITSYVGSHPRNKGGNAVDPNQVYDFTIPADAKSGPAIFAWSWNNKVGNREFYMDCAPVTIGGSGTNTLAALPDMFAANIDKFNTCKVGEGSSVEYPNPGATVQRGAGPFAPPTGNCGAAASGGSDAPAAPAPAPAPGPAAPAKAAGCKRYGGAVGAGSIVRRATVTVQPGDTCTNISQILGTTTAALISANPSINAGCTNLTVGQVLQTPC